MPMNTMQQHLMVAMHARDRGMSVDHRNHHMAMMKQSGTITDNQPNAVMRKMHTMHGSAMTSPAIPVAMIPPKQASACGTYIYCKAGACLDARNKK
jgi:hypothetical protein